SDLDVPKLPRSGFDFTGWDRFVELGIVLSRGDNPSPAQWNAFFKTPAARMTERPVSLRALQLAFIPSMARERDSLASRSEDAQQAVYLKRSFDRREQIQRWRDTTTLQPL